MPGAIEMKPPSSTYGGHSPIYPLLVSKKPSTARGRFDLFSDFVDALQHLIDRVSLSCNKSTKLGKRIKLLLHVSEMAVQFVRWVPPAKQRSIGDYRSAKCFVERLIWYNIRVSVCELRPKLVVVCCELDHLVWFDDISR